MKRSPWRAGMSCATPRRSSVCTRSTLSAALARYPSWPNLAGLCPDLYGQLIEHCTNEVAALTAISSGDASLTRYDVLPEAFSCALKDVAGPPVSLWIGFWSVGSIT